MLSSTGGRDTQDVGATVKLLAAHQIAAIVLPLGKLDLAMAAGKLMLTMLAAVAEMARDLLAERTHPGLARVKSEDKRLGRPSKTTPEQRTESLPCMSRERASARWTAVRGVARQHSERREANAIGSLSSA